MTKLNAFFLVVGVVVLIDYISSFVNLVSKTDDLEKKVVGKTPDGFHRYHFEEWLQNCYPKPGRDWCGTPYQQPRIIKDFGAQLEGQ